MSVISKLACTSLLLLQHSQSAAAAPHDRRDSWFCNGNGADWDGDLWNDNDMGEFLNNRVSYYSGAGGEWPTDVQGVPRVLAQYGDDKDNDFNWGTQCIGVEGTCDLDEGGIKVPACVGNEARAFSLWSMRNAANFVQLYYNSLSDIFDTTGLKVADITTTFLSADAPKLEMGASSWLIVAQGVIGSATAFIPIAAATSGITIGVAGVGVGVLAGLKKPTLDPRFTTFADLESRVADIKTNTQSAINEYFNRLFHDTPPQGDLNLGTELSRLLESGSWANQDMAQLPYDKTDMAKLIHSGIISEAWNSQQVALVKWSTGTLGNIHGTNIDPCYGAPMVNELIQDGTVACENDRNYVILRMSNDGNPWNVAGWDSQNLEAWGFTQKIIIDNSEHRQAMSATWIDRSVDVLVNDLSGFASDPPDDIMDRVMPFNLPVCDLDNLDGDIKSAKDKCDAGIPELCLWDIIKQNCPRLLLSEQPFPYSK